MSDKIRIIIIFAALFAGSAAVTACNTIGGMGEDVESAGEYVDKKAEQNKGY